LLLLIGCACVLPSSSRIAWAAGEPPAAEAPPVPVPAAPTSAPRQLAPTISVITFGPGTETFAKFGHDAILVSDPRQPPSRREIVFNYGTFSFHSPWLILDFLKGRLSYWLSASSLEQTVAVYRRANRTVSVQELSLAPDRARALTAFLWENLKDANKYYRYDYYRDNCATRIRDALDRHLDGRLAAVSRSPAPLTYRDHTRRLTVGAPFLFFGLDLAMGPVIDQPLTDWEEMFLPSRVAAKLAEAKDDEGRPLVRRQYVLFEAKRPPEATGAPGYGWGWLVMGSCWGAALYVLGRLRGRAAGVAHSVALAGTGLFTGLLGAALLVLWLLTDHDVTYWNQNVLSCPAWALALTVLAFDLLRREPRHARLLMRLMAFIVGGALLALLLQVLPLRQAAGPAVSLFLPLWLGAGLGVWERLGRPVLAARSGALPGAPGAPPVAPG
jgi:hypothetical protein